MQVAPVVIINFPKDGLGLPFHLFFASQYGKTCIYVKHTLTQLKFIRKDHYLDFWVEECNEIIILVSLYYTVFKRKIQF